MPQTTNHLEEIVANICATLTTKELNKTDLVTVLSHLLFSIGASLENCGDLTSENVLTRYASEPTLGNALMAQAMHMKETWSQSEREEDNERTTDIQRETEKV